MAASMKSNLAKWDLLTTQCFDEFFVKFNFFHGACLKSAISKVLGLAIVVGSALVKLPQLYKVYASGSVEGLSLEGQLLELLGFTGTAAYSIAKGFPFSTWGETVFLVVQTAAIVGVILTYRGRAPHALAFLAVYGAVAALLTSGAVPLAMLAALQTVNIPLVLAAKLTQAWTNYSGGTTGQLSAVMVWLIFLGGLARVFTSLVDTGDLLMVASYGLAAICNAILAGQILWYWNVDQRVSPPPSPPRENVDKDKTQ